MATCRSFNLMLQGCVNESETGPVTNVSIRHSFCFIVLLFNNQFSFKQDKTYRHTLVFFFSKAFKRHIMLSEALSNLLFE